MLQPAVDGNAGAAWNGFHLAELIVSAIVIRSDGAPVDVVRKSVILAASRRKLYGRGA
jgi:hypothetical protein